MRVGLFGDVHGNLVALDAVLALMEGDRLDQMVCLGDVAITGPYPHEVVQRIKDLRCPVVLGNWDDWTMDVCEGRRSFDGCRPIDRWCAEQMADDDLAFLHSFQQTITIDLGGASLFCFHGSPRDYSEVIDSGTPYQEVDEMLQGRRQGILAAGHTHIAMLRRHGDALIVNPGSLSENWNCTVEPDVQRFNPWAEYAIVDHTAGRLTVDFQRVPIDVDAVIAAAFAREMPGAEGWSAQWVRK